MTWPFRSMTWHLQLILRPARVLKDGRGPGGVKRRLLDFVFRGRLVGVLARIDKRVASSHGIFQGACRNRLGDLLLLSRNEFFSWRGRLLSLDSCSQRTS
jgi:hypothetical protein